MITGAWWTLAVELAVCAWIVVLLVADTLVPPSRKSSLWIIALAGVGLGIGLLLALPQSLSIGRFSGYFKLLFLITTGVVILMTREFRHHLPEHLGAFYMLLFTALLGMLVLSSINDLLMLFLGLELLTFSLYIMAAYLKRDARSIEAGMKYLILGSVSSGFLVYGIALLYGFAGSTNFLVIHTVLAAGPPPLTAQAGLLLVLAGLGFKIGAVPFQWWVPDVYEGAPTPVVALLSVGSKMAGVVALLRLLDGAMQPLAGLWAPLLAVASATTMCYGNLSAIPQTNIKRLMGYSSIGHAGYLLMGLSTATQAGVEAVGYYLLAYVASTLAVFLVIVIASEAVGADELEQYNGLSKRSPMLAAALFIGLLSLAGVPPLAGFAGKLFVLLATVESRQLWLVAIGAVNVAISLYYYLMVVKRMYLGSAATSAAITVSTPATFTLAALLIAILLIGVVQGPFVQRIAWALQP